MVTMLECRRDNEWQLDEDFRLLQEEMLQTLQDYVNKRK